MDRHRVAVSEALADGSPRRVRQLYAELSEDLAVGVGGGEVPVLSYRETADEVARLLETTTGPHLDVGCGPNPLASIMVARDGRAIIGLDVGIGMIQLARRIAMETGAEFAGVVGDAERLPFPDRIFGSVVCDDTIEHLPDDRAAIAELARVTDLDGAIVLATPNRIRMPVLLKRVRDRLRGRRRDRSAYYAVQSHLREYTWRDLQRLIAPFAEVTERGFVPWPGTSIAGRAASWFTSTRVGIVVGRVVILRLRPRSSDESLHI